MEVVEEGHSPEVEGTVAHPAEVEAVAHSAEEEVILVPVALVGEHQEDLLVVVEIKAILEEEDISGARTEVEGELLAVVVKCTFTANQ